MAAKIAVGRMWRAIRMKIGAALHPDVHLGRATRQPLRPQLSNASHDSKQQKDRKKYEEDAHSNLVAAAAATAAGAASA